MHTNQPRVFTDADNERIREMHAIGKSWASIADAMHVAPTSMRRYIHDVLGLSPQDREIHQRVERCRVLWDQGATAGQIALKMRITKNAVVGIAHRNGFEKRANPIKPKASAQPVARIEVKRKVLNAVRPWTADEIATIREMHAASRTALEMHGKLDRGLDAVYSKIRELDLTMKRGPAVSWTGADDDVIRRCVGEGISVPKIGLLLDRPRSSVWARVQTLGLIVAPQAAAPAVENAIDHRRPPFPPFHPIMQAIYRDAGLPV